MRKSRFSESKIVGILHEVESGIKVADVCRTHVISAQTYYVWDGMSDSDIKHLKELEEDYNHHRQYEALDNLSPIQCLKRHNHN